MPWTVVAAVGDFSVGQVAGFVVAWIVTHAITGVVTGVITLRVLERRVDRMDERQDTLDKAHQACRLDARDRYAHRDDLVNIIGQNNQHYQALLDRMDKGFSDTNDRIDETHNRITTVDRRVSAVEGRFEA